MKYLVRAYIDDPEDPDREEEEFEIESKKKLIWAEALAEARKRFKNVRSVTKIEIGG